jgi:hypothetical protein
VPSESIPQHLLDVRAERCVGDPSRSKCTGQTQNELGIITLLTQELGNSQLWHGRLGIDRRSTWRLRGLVALTSKWHARKGYCDDFEPLIPMSCGREPWGAGRRRSQPRIAKSHRGPENPPCCYYVQYGVLAV